MATINWQEKIFQATPKNFDSVALEVFNHQYRHNPIYQQFCRLRGIQKASVKDITAIPFLPIQFFKTHTIQSGEFIPEKVFESSGTTGTDKSKHPVKSLSWYKSIFRSSFEHLLGNPDPYCWLGLLPGYLERPDSSLVYMTDSFIKDSLHPLSGFHLHNFEALNSILSELEAAGQPTLLLGVSFALLDFAERFPMQLKHTIVMETGGMKGRKEELPKEALHRLLKDAFGVKTIYSEYGMTELMSQAYSTGNGRYASPPWMKILIRSEDNPLLVEQNSPLKNSQGAINIIDLANIHSCSFIATDDLGKIHSDGTFEILGRLDQADIRGCSQLVF